MSDPRDKAMKTLREYEAILALINGLSQPAIQSIASAKARLPLLSKVELRTFTHQTRDTIKEIRHTFKIEAPARELIAILEAVEKSSDEKVQLFPKYVLKGLVGRYDLVMVDFDTLPEHADIHISVGKNREPGKVQVYLLEAILFEDMAATFNLCKERRLGFDRDRDSKKTGKTLDALYRATVTTAFYFVESYLNGLAFDYFVKNEKRLTADDKQLLTEWDITRNRAKHLSLREKALKYSRMILVAEYPPLQENNCSELAFISGKAKELRDAIAHPAARRKESEY